MDATDAKILDILQTNASLSAADIAADLALEEADVAARIKRLEDDGTILGRVALLNPRKVGAQMTAFVAVIVAEHSTEALEAFHAEIEAIPEVVEFWRMGGQVDYLLRVVVPDIDAYDAFYKKLIAAAKLKDVSSTFALEQVKNTTRLPIAGDA